MEATGREQVKRDTLEKDFDHDVEVKEHGKQINASNTLEKDLDHQLSETKRLKEETDQKTSTKDVEEKVPEQKQATLEKDLAHGSDDDEVEKRKKATTNFISKFQSTAEEYISGGGDSFGANCWFD